MCSWVKQRSCDVENISSVPHLSLQTASCHCKDVLKPLLVMEAELFIPRDKNLSVILF